MAWRWNGRRCFIALVVTSAVAASGSMSLGREATPSYRTSVEAGCRELLPARYALLDRELVRGDLRIRWASAGVHAPADQRDGARNGVPDVIDDLMTQLVAARAVYGRGLGLADPLAQKRYQAARAITFFVMDLPRGNGLAFDEITRLPDAKGDGAPCSLAAVVSSRLDFSHNVTGAHELFHLFQYGYARFKAPWLLEGMARWSEGFFAGAAAPRLAGAAPANCQEATRLRYGASAFWTVRWETAGVTASVSEAAGGARYRNGFRVMAVNGDRGGDRVRADLETLARLSRRTAADMGLPEHDWPEAVQKSDRFNGAICAALR